MKTKDFSGKRKVVVACVRCLREFELLYRAGILSHLVEQTHSR